jgi:hypothetical protein
MLEPSPSGLAGNRYECPRFSMIATGPNQKVGFFRAESFRYPRGTFWEARCVWNKGGVRCAR